MIVKIQLSLATTEGERQALIYDEPRTVIHQCEVTPELEDFVAGAEKSFAYADVKLERDGFRLDLLEPAPWQNW